MISAHQALAARRLLMLVAALSATLAAHALSAGGLAIVPAAPLVWGTLAALAVLRPPRPGARWRRRGPGAVLWRLAALQAALHIAMTAAPWAFGLAVHHRPALVAPAALAAHGAAAAALTALIVRAERLLTLALRAVRAVRRSLARRPARGRGATILRIEGHPAPRALRARPRRARGPPRAGVRDTPVTSIHGGHPCAFDAPSSRSPLPA